LIFIGRGVPEKALDALRASQTTDRRICHAVLTMLSRHSSVAKRDLKFARALRVTPVN